MNFTIAYNNISDNFYFDYKAVQSNPTELFFLNFMNVLKISIFNSMTILTIPNCKIEVLRKQIKLTDQISNNVHTTPPPFSHRSISSSVATLFGFVARFVRVLILTPNRAVIVRYWLAFLNKIFTCAQFF